MFIHARRNLFVAAAVLLLGFSLSARSQQGLTRRSSVQTRRSGVTPDPRSDHGQHLMCRIRRVARFASSSWSCPRVQNTRLADRPRAIGQPFCRRRPWLGSKHALRDVLAVIPGVRWHS